MSEPAGSTRVDPEPARSTRAGPEPARSTRAGPEPARSTRAVEWALVAGNFAIGCGVMVVPGAMNDLLRSLSIGVAAGGQLVTVAAAVMALGAPLLAAALGRIDRRSLLVVALAWYAIGHALSALAPHYAALMPLRAACMLGAAVFTPQAAAAIGALVPAEQRGRAITFVFLGWSLASVVGMPIASSVGAALGWRWAFALVAVLSVLAAVAVAATLPRGVRPPVAGVEAWRAVLQRPLLLVVVAVTGLSATAQFTLFPYLAPIFGSTLGAGAQAITLLFFWFGVFGLAGNLLASRWIDRSGSAPMVAALLALMTLSFALWPLATGVAAMAAVLVPWALGCFGTNSAQQARLGAAAPALAPVLMALNTSAIYLGQALGAAGGGALVAANQAAGRAPFAALAPAALAWMIAALGLSLWAARAMRAPAPTVAPAP